MPEWELKPRGRLQLIKLDEPEQTLTVQFNPTQFQEVVQANYTELAPIGGTGKTLHFSGNENHKFSMELFFHANHNQPGSRNPVFDSNLIPDEGFTNVRDVVSTIRDRSYQILDARNFLLSLVYPSRSDEIIQSAPSRVLLVWPEMVSMTVVVRRINITHELFTLHGSSRQYRANMEFEEVRDVRILQEDVLFNGTIRGPGKDNR